MSDEPESTPPTVPTRLVAMTISEERALAHINAGFLRVGSEIITDPNHIADGPIVVCPPPLTEQQAVA